jgi:hypothetical protein
VVKDYGANEGNSVVSADFASTAKFIVAKEGCRHSGGPHPGPRDRVEHLLAAVTTSAKGEPPASSTLHVELSIARTGWWRYQALCANVRNTGAHACRCRVP